MVVATSLVLVPDSGPDLLKYQVVVNSSNSTANLRAADVARIFLKRRRQWGDGQAIQPIDQSVASSVRGVFSRTVLDMSLGEVRDHWMKVLLSGRDVPPLVRDGDANVLEFILENPGAIGYVSSETPLPTGVRPVGIEQ
jgi:ABC-type phosphate transport system substrate-binding protein